MLIFASVFKGGKFDFQDKQIIIRAENTALAVPD